MATPGGTTRAADFGSPNPPPSNRPNHQCGPPTLRASRLPQRPPGSGSLQRMAPPGRGFTTTVTRRCSALHPGPTGAPASVTDCLHQTRCAGPANTSAALARGQRHGVRFASGSTRPGAAATGDAVACPVCARQRRPFHRARRHLLFAVPDACGRFAARGSGRHAFCGPWRRPRQGAGHRRSSGGHYVGTPNARATFPLA